MSIDKALKKSRDRGLAIELILKDGRELGETVEVRDFDDNTVILTNGKEINRADILTAKV